VGVEVTEWGLWLVEGNERMGWRGWLLRWVVQVGSGVQALAYMRVICVAIVYLGRCISRSDSWQYTRKRGYCDLLIVLYITICHAMFVEF